MIGNILKLFFQKDVQTRNVFGPGESLLISGFQCDGNENNISQCPSLDSCDDNSRAGVICTKEFGL